MMTDKKPAIDIDGLRGYLKPGFDDARAILKAKGRTEADVNDPTPITGSSTSRGLYPY